MIASSNNKLDKILIKEEDLISMVADIHSFSLKISQ